MQSNKRAPLHTLSKTRSLIRPHHQNCFEEKIRNLNLPKMITTSQKTNNSHRPRESTSVAHLVRMQVLLVTLLGLVSFTTKSQSTKTFTAMDVMTPTFTRTFALPRRWNATAPLLTITANSFPKLFGARAKSSTTNPDVRWSRSGDLGRTPARRSCRTRSRGRRFQTPPCRTGTPAFGWNCWRWQCGRRHLATKTELRELSSEDLA